MLRHVALCLGMTLTMALSASARADDPPVLPTDEQLEYIRDVVLPPGYCVDYSLYGVEKFDGYFNVRVVCQLANARYIIAYIDFDWYNLLGIENVTAAQITDP